MLEKRLVLGIASNSSIHIEIIGEFEKKGVLIKREKKKKCRFEKNGVLARFFFIEEWCFQSQRS